MLYIVCHIRIRIMSNRTPYTKNIQFNINLVKNKIFLLEIKISKYKLYQGAAGLIHNGGLICYVIVHLYQKNTKKKGRIGRISTVQQSI